MPSRLSFTVRKYHKWLSLIIGVQALLWLMSGTYMVVVDLAFIHGDHLVQKLKLPLPADATSLVPFSVIRERFPTAHEIVLEAWQGKPHYRVYESAETRLIDAVTGNQRSPIDKTDAIAVAQYHYAGSGEVSVARLLINPDQVPGEAKGLPLPLWQVSFNDFSGTVFYISATNGDLVTRRHIFWRIFDFVWMLHIMDYENREDVNNNLFRAAATLGLIMSMFGLWLLYFSFRKTKRVSSFVDVEGL